MIYPSKNTTQNPIIIQSPTKASNNVNALLFFVMGLRLNCFYKMSSLLPNTIDRRGSIHMSGIPARSVNGWGTPNNGMDQSCNRPYQPLCYNLGRGGHTSSRWALELNYFVSNVKSYF